MRFKTVIFSALASWLMLPGCVDMHNNENTEDETPMTKEGLANLCTGSLWQLQKMVRDNQQLNLLENTAITFTCDAQGKVAGTASINRYSGAFLLNDNGTLSWQGAGFLTTKMGGPPELMEQEQNFLKTLANTTQGRVERSILVMESRDKSNFLEFFQITDP